MAKDDKKKKAAAAKKKKEAAEAKARKKKGLPPKKKRRLIPKLIVLAVLVLAGVWGFSYSQSIDKMPWQWSGDEWKGFLTFAQHEAEEAGDVAKHEAEKGVEKVKNFDWDKWKEKAEAAENDLEKKLADMKEKREAEAAAKTGAGAVDGEDPEASHEPDSYEQACQKFSDGLKQMKKAKRDKKKLLKAADTLREADKLFEKAEAEAKGDEDKLEDIQEWRKRCGQYLQDCSKMAE